MVKPTTFKDSRFNEDGKWKEKLSKKNRGKRAYESAMLRRVDIDFPLLVQNFEKG